MSGLVNHLEVWRRRWKLQRRLRAARGGRLILADRPAGFFSLYFQVLGALEVARGLSAQLVLRFNRAAYRTAQTSGNGWWTDYFTADTFGPPAPPEAPEVAVTADDILYKLTHLGSRLSRARAHRWSHLLCPREHLTQAVATFAANQFGSAPIVGIHYRGTDKVTGQRREAERVQPESIVRLLASFPSACKFFVATDERDFLDLTRARFPGRTLALAAQRSSDGAPVHLTAAGNGGGNLGNEALLDALLLARTDFLLRTDSNLSQASACLNLRLPVFNLTTRARMLAADPERTTRQLLREFNQVQRRPPAPTTAAHGP
jgi:hypothetical protein